MQTGDSFSFSNVFRVESRQTESMCAGFRDDNGASTFGKDTISIQGISHDASRGNPQFLAVLEERIVSGLI